MNSTSAHILVLEDASGIRTFKLTKPIYTLGRGKKADIFIDNDACSRHHSTLVRVERDGRVRYQILDGNPKKGQPSENGTYVNGERISLQTLGHKDRLLLGSEQVALTYLWVSRSCLSRQDLQTITVESSVEAIGASGVISIAPNGDAILLRERDAD